MTDREREWRKVLKIMSAADEKIFDDGTEKLLDDLMDKELEDKKGDRIYFIALSLDGISETLSVSMPPDSSDEEAVLAGIMEVVSAFGRFGLAVLDKKKDPFSRLEEATRSVASMTEYFAAKKAEETQNKPG
jgi:hypothetical protein